MRTYEISSPNAAETYFSHSFVGDMSMAVAALLGRFRPSKSASRRAPPPVTAAKQGWLERLDGWLWRQEQKDREDYLAGSGDRFELERRMEALEHGTAARYY